MLLHELFVEVQRLSLEIEHLKTLFYNSHTIWDSPLLSGLVGALVVFILNIFYNTHRDTRDKKFQSRSFIVAEEIYNLGTRLEGYNYGPEDDVRLIETDSLKRIIQLEEREHKKLRNGNFLKTVNTGPYIVTNVKITLEIFGEKVKKQKRLMLRFL